MNMVFAAESASGVAGPVSNLIPGHSSQERAAYFIELIAEIQHHINRVAQCATNNGVGLIYKVELVVRQNTSVAPTGVAARMRALCGIEGSLGLESNNGGYAIERLNFI
jgi:hypothetical protein